MTSKFMSALGLAPLLLALCGVTAARAQVDLGLGPSTPIPLVVVLWKDQHYGGTKRELVVDTPNLKLQGFNDTASSVGVHPGPDYLAWKQSHGGREPTVTLYTDAGGLGKSIVLSTGIYPDLKAYAMNDAVSSVYFSDAQPTATPSGTAASFNSIPFVLRFTNGSEMLWMIESTQDIGGDYGSNWNDAAKSVVIVKRSSAGATDTLEFCADKFFDQCYFPTSPGGKPLGAQTSVQLLSPDGFKTPKATLSSVRIR